MRVGVGVGVGVGVAVEVGVGVIVGVRVGVGVGTFIDMVGICRLCVPIKRLSGSFTSPFG